MAQFDINCFFIYSQLPCYCDLGSVSSKLDLDGMRLTVEARVKTKRKKVRVVKN